MKRLLSIFSLFLAITFAQAQNEPSVDIALQNATTTSMTVRFTPNAACASYYILLITPEEEELWLSMMFETVEAMVQQWGRQLTGMSDYTFDELVPATNYTVYALPLDAASTPHPVCSANYSTLTAGDDGEALCTIQVTEIGDTSARVIVTPNASTALFHDMLITVEGFNELGQDSVIIYMKDGQPFYSEDDWIWPTLSPATDYYALAIAKNANDEWGPLVQFPFTTNERIAIASYNRPTFTVYPNPIVNGTFSISADYGNGNRYATIYDMNGKAVICQEWSGANASISVGNLPVGSYLLRISNESNTSLHIQKLIVY